MKMCSWANRKRKPFFFLSIVPPSLFFPLPTECSVPSSLPPQEEKKNTTSFVKLIQSAVYCFHRVRQQDALQNIWLRTKASIENR